MPDDPFAHIHVTESHDSRSTSRTSDDAQCRQFFSVQGALSGTEAETRIRLHPQPPEVTYAAHVAIDVQPVFYDRSNPQNNLYGKSACPGYSLPMEALDTFVMTMLTDVLTAPKCMEALQSGLEREFANMAKAYKPMDAAERNRLKTEQAEIERARRQIADTIKGNPAAIELMKPEIERLAAEAEMLKRKLQQVQPAAEPLPTRQRVERGLAFYRERVIGPLAGGQPDGNTDGRKSGRKSGKKEKTTAVAEAQRQEPPARENGGASERPTERACVAELKALFRLVGLKLRYDPDTKEGTLDFSPFVRYATG